MMSSMKKRVALALGAVAVAAALAAPAYAMRGGEGGPCGRFDGERFEQRMEKRQQALHDQLKLSASQEKAWQHYSETVKSLLPKREDFNRDELRALSAPERAERMLSRSQERLDKMRKGSEAMKTFYATLSPEQKKTFDQQSFGGFHGQPAKGR